MKHREAKEPKLKERRRREENRSRDFLPRAWLRNIERHSFG